MKVIFLKDLKKQGKKNEIKVNAQTKARDDYWIPCSMAITNLQNKIAELAPKTNTYISFYGDNSCEAEVSELLKNIFVRGS